MTSSQRHGLGRGLSALIPKSGGGAVDSVDVDLIVPNPQQPRVQFDAAALEELADSIREHGVLQPVVVSELRSDLGTKTYQLIAGERRLQAARMAGIERIAVVVREAAGGELLELALVENLQREDLNPLEEAMAFKRLCDEFELTQQDVAKRVGRSRAAVANTMRLLTLEEDIRASLASSQISEGHARALLAIEDSSLRLDAWRRIVADSLTVRQSEEIARALKETSSSRAGAPNVRRARASEPEVRELEGRLRRVLGAAVSVFKGRRGGRIVIRFHSEDELEGIIERLGGGR